MTEYINIIQNKSVNIHKNTLYNPSEPHNILPLKKPLDRKMLNLESMFKGPIETDVCLPCGPEWWQHKLMGT